MKISTSILLTFLVGGLEKGFGKRKGKGRGR